MFDSHLSTTCQSYQNTLPLLEWMWHLMGAPFLSKIKPFLDTDLLANDSYLESKVIWTLTALILSAG